MWPTLPFLESLVTFTEEILTGKLHSLSSHRSSTEYQNSHNSQESTIAETPFRDYCNFTKIKASPQMSFWCLSRECCTGKFIVPLCVLTIIRSCEMNLYNLKIRDFMKSEMSLFCPNIFKYNFWKYLVNFYYVYWISAWDSKKKIYKLGSVACCLLKRVLNTQISFKATTPSLEI